MMPLYPKIINLQLEQIEIVKVYFDKGLAGDFFKDVHFPPVAAKLYWLHKLAMRMKISQEELYDLHNPIMDTEEGVHLIECYEQMMKLLKAEENAVFSAWAKEVPAQIRKNLAKPLLIRDENKLLSLNFDPQLVATLREVKYMQILDQEGIPQEAQNLFARVEELDRNIKNLNRTIQWYNWLRSKTVPVELELIKDQMTVIDQAINIALETLDWTEDVWDTINSIHENVKDLYDRVYLAQVNLKNVTKNMEKWANYPLYDRKDGKKDQLLYLEDRIERRLKCYNNIKKSAVELSAMLSDNYQLFFKTSMPSPDDDEEEEIEEVAAPTPVGSRKSKRKKGEKTGKEKPSISREESPEGKKTPGSAKKGKGKKGAKVKQEVKEEIKTEEEELVELTAEEHQQELEVIAEARRQIWDQYLLYIDGLVCDLFLKGVMFSFGVIYSEMEGFKAPLFEVALELQDPFIRFKPSLDEEDESCFYRLMQSLIEDIITMAEMIPRVAPGSDSIHYRIIIDSNEDVTDMVKEILFRVKQGTEKAIQYGEGYTKYSYLWLENRQTFLRNFLVYGKGDVSAREKAKSTVAMNVLPNIQQFKEQIDMYEDLYHDVSTLNYDRVNLLFFKFLGRENRVGACNRRLVTNRRKTSSPSYFKYCLQMGKFVQTTFSGTCYK